MNSTQRNTLLILFLLVIVCGGTAYYFFAKYRNLKENPEAITQEETEKLVEEVGRLMLLPPGETPTVATVNDPEALRSQPFFKNAKRGDKVLIYSNAGRAILYDPVAGKIIEVATINIGDTTPQTPPSSAESTSTNENLE